jgi:Protein of unknown function (DUF3618)
MDNTPRRVSNDATDAAGRGTESTREDARDVSGDVNERTREIRNQIEETRVEMGQTIDAIQEKLKPRNLVASATDRVRNAATERVREMADTASHTAQQAMDYTRDMTSSMADSARRNPIPLALIGIGAAWLLANRSRRTSYGRGDVRRDSRAYGREHGNWASDEERYASQRYEGEGGMTQNLTESASRVASRTREYASDATDSIRRIARQRQNQLQRMVYENPLIVGAVALLLGAAFGLAVPKTETEDELMGEARDNMVDRARDMARDVAGQVQSAAGSVADAAGEVVRKSQS